MPKVATFIKFLPMVATLFLKVATLLHFFLKLLHCYYECCYINVAVNFVKNVATNFARNVATANAMDDVISNFCSNFSTKNVCSNFFKNVATIFCADIKILNAEQYRHAGRVKNPCLKNYISDIFMQQSLHAYVQL